MTQVHLQLLGDFCLTYGGKPVTTLETPRLRALVAYLALHRHAPQTRHHLAFLFWPDSTEAQALTNLRKQLYFLSNRLPAADPLLQATRQTVQWSPAVGLGLDVTAFAALLTQANTVAGSQAISLLCQAIDLYRGDLLPECYDEWIFPQREALREQYAGGQTRLVVLLEEQREYSAAISYAQRLLRHDPLHEPTYRTLLRLYALQGDRAAALRIYHTCVTQLREELGVDPDAETQHAYERLLQGEAVTTRQPELAASAPFVGRQPEWQQLQQSWRTAMQGQPQVVLIAGEAGIGKTRLAEEFLNWAIHQGFATTRARCYAAEGRLTYAPIIEWLRSELLRPQRTKIEPAWQTELARLLPELLTDDPALPHPEPITQSWQRHHLFEAATRALLAANQPLVLLLDDLQWCDRETLELLHFLLRNAVALGQPKLLLLGTARLPDEVAATHPLYELLNPLSASDMLAQIDLARLNEAESAELARQMADGELDSQALCQLFADTAGNPLFVVETLRAKQGIYGETVPPLTRGRLGGGQQFPPAILPIAESEAIVQHLPPKVLAVIQARLGQLSATARELCEWAAVVGRAFTLDLLASASQIAPDKAVNALDELWQRRIIREQGSAAYDFSHDRLRDVAAAGISRVRWRYLHRSIAEVLESQNENQLDSVATQIAAHYDAAGMTEKAIDYYQQAAEAGLHIYANQEAINYLNRALGLLHTLPSSRTRVEREYHLLIMLGPPLIAVQGYGSQHLRDHYLGAHKLAEQLNYPRNPAILRILAIYYLTHRKFDLAYNFGVELLQIARIDQKTVNLFLYVEGCYTLGVISFWQGHFQHARQHLELGIAAYEPEQHADHIARYGQDPGVICMSRLAWSLWYLGYPEQASQHIQQAMALANLLKHPFSIEYALTLMQWLYYDVRDQAGASEVDELVIAHQARSEFPAMVQVLRSVIRGKELADRGLATDGIEMIRAGMALAAVIQYDLMFKSHFQAALAQALSRAGAFVHAYEAIDVAIDHTAIYGDNYYLAELHRLKGEISLANGKSYEVAEQSFHQALEISRHQAAKSLELRAAMSMARLWNQQGKRGEAYSLLAEVYNWFTEGFDTTDLQEAQALLEQLV